MYAHRAIKASMFNVFNIYVLNKKALLVTLFKSAFLLGIMSAVTHSFVVLSVLVSCSCSQMNDTSEKIYITDDISISGRLRILQFCRQSGWGQCPDVYNNLQ